jgi:hypothetical protein
MSQGITRAALAATTAVALGLTSLGSATAQTMPTTAVAAPAAGVLQLEEGAEVRIRFEEALTSATAAAGDQFVISLADDVEGVGGTLSEGYRGRGEVVSARKRGFMGKAGELNVRVDYIKVGDKKIKLRANKAGEGQGALGATVALTVLFGPVGLLMRGKDLEINRGQTITAYLDESVELPTPLPAAPQS